MGATDALECDGMNVLCSSVTLCPGHIRVHHLTHLYALIHLDQILSRLYLSLLVYLIKVVLSPITITIL